MPRSATLAILVMIGLSASAQSWCPPGATWTYESQGFVLLQNGYTTATYTNDTLLGSRVGQVIRRSTVGFYDGQLDTMANPYPFVTSHDGPLVSLWSPAQGWDTLFNFSAVPGDTWQIAHSNDDCVGWPAIYSSVTVVDTGTITIEAIDLHYLDIMVGTSPSRITERLGHSLAMFIESGCFADECYCDLRCYHDDELNYVRPGFDGACDLVLGVNDIAITGIRIFPSPATDHLNVELPVSGLLIELRDALGRLVASGSVGGNVVRFDVSALVPGLFTCIVRNSYGSLLWRGSWMKQ